MRLYQEECIQQRHLAWLQEEARRRRVYYCTNVGNRIMTPAGKVQDCEADVGQYLSWTRPAADGSSIKITAASFPDAPRDQCEIEVSEPLGPALHEAALQIAKTDRSLGQPPHHYAIGSPTAADGQEEGWVWAAEPQASERAPQLQLSDSRPGGAAAHIWTLTRITSGRIPALRNPNLP